MRKGILTSYVLVFGTIFLILLGGLLGFILTELKISKQKLAWHEALGIAEAGIEYYKWCANNNVLSNCQLEKTYQDINGKEIGKFSLQIDTASNCGLIISQKVKSTGWTFQYPELKRKISIFFGRESVAKYSYILNSNVWVGSDHVVRGPFHSNGGIRFDGQNLSLVSSAQEEWVCTNTFGCFGLCPSECQIENNQCVCPGVFSTTQVSNRSLFDFPVVSFDFEGVTADLAQIKQASQNSGGIYLPPSDQIDSQGKGWHLIFNEGGTFEARIITQLSPTLAYSLEEGWHVDFFTISGEYSYQTFTIPTSCSVIYIEDDLWPEGKIRGKVTLASANLIDPNQDTQVILNGNLDYSTTTGRDGLTLIGEKNILIGPDSPENMILRGILIAQKGRFARNHYPGNKKESLIIYGSIVSNGRVGTKWINQAGHVVSGYLNRETYPDRNLIYQPPVFTPFLTSQFKIINWEEL